MVDTASPLATAFGLTPDGRAATLFTLQNEHLRVSITNYGGRIVSIRVPDRRGEVDEVVLGFDDVSSYTTAGGAFGALLGRTANRIAGGTFTLNGQTYQLARNDRSSNLHGGPHGFDCVLWAVEHYSSGPVPTLGLRHVSPHGDQGFPGLLDVQARYRLAEHTLWLDFRAQADRPTLASLSAHPYFNLSGSGAADVLAHRITIHADAFLPTDDQQAPTGEIRSVAATPFDFRVATPLGERIRLNDAQLRCGCGYDHYYVLSQHSPQDPQVAARAYSEASGRLLEVLTTHRGLQLYSGNQLRGSVAGRGGLYRQSAGLAFEPQGFPDAIHHPCFPSNVLHPGQTYCAIIGYRFLNSSGA